MMKSRRKDEVGSDERLTHQGGLQALRAVVWNNGTAVDIFSSLCSRGSCHSFAIARQQGRQYVKQKGVAVPVYFIHLIFISFSCITRDHFPFDSLPTV